MSQVYEQRLLHSSFPSGNQTWQWEISLNGGFHGNIIYKCWIFHIYIMLVYWMVYVMHHAVSFGWFFCHVLLVMSALELKKRAVELEQGSQVCMLIDTSSSTIPDTSWCNFRAWRKNTPLMTLMSTQWNPHCLHRKFTHHSSFLLVEKITRSLWSTFLLLKFG